MTDIKTADKRPVATDALKTLGTIIDDKAARDAIHLAVEPAIAAHRLRPGEDVGFLSDGSVGCDAEPYVGIVDPFLKGSVKKGERFWLVVYPRTITSLRHVWEHPGFPATTDNSSPIIRSKERSEAWLRDFVERSDCPRYETVIAKAVDQSDSWDEDHLHFNDQNAHGDIPPEFWDHVEIVTGQKIENRPTYFSCSC